MITAKPGFDQFCSNAHSYLCAYRSSVSSCDDDRHELSVLRAVRLAIYCQQNGANCAGVCDDGDHLQQAMQGHVGTYVTIRRAGGGA